MTRSFAFVLALPILFGAAVAAINILIDHDLGPAFTGGDDPRPSRLLDMFSSHHGRRA